MKTRTILGARCVFAATAVRAAGNDIQFRGHQYRGSPSYEENLDMKAPSACRQHGQKSISAQQSGEAVYTCGLGCECPPDGSSS